MGIIIHCNNNIIFHILIYLFYVFKICLVNFTIDTDLRAPTKHMQEVQIHLLVLTSAIETGHKTVSNLEPMTQKNTALTMMLHTYSSKVTLMQSLKNLFLVTTKYRYALDKKYKDARQPTQGKTITHKLAGCGLNSLPAVG